MPVDPSLVGRTYPPSRPYEVGREKIREFADAIGDPSPVFRDPEAAQALGYPDVLAPPTFPIVFALDGAFAVLADLGIELQNVVHGDQNFRYARPLRPGDRLVTTVEIRAVKHLAGNDVLTVDCVSATEAGEHVVTSTSTLVCRGESA
ncbi:MaoC family dehydratase N-terminal domain-containing protein [Sporichthya polymorpha]|uniref:MaoC family dehydratase N-terminal domain-containing protein n=1 Tax=Sporichthya polymorpha TaxID=35751 RepID=UPI0003768B2C|nr:MaoC family dehydratase N-terminal domain-containing protein [Sporichthya polymorpha]